MQIIFELSKSDSIIVSLIFFKHILPRLAENPR